MSSAFDSVFGKARGHGKALTLLHLQEQMHRGELDHVYDRLRELPLSAQRLQIGTQLATVKFPELMETNKYKLTKVASQTTVRFLHAGQVVTDPKKRLHLWADGDKYVELSQPVEPKAVCGWKVSTSPYTRVRRGLWNDVKNGNSSGSFTICKACAVRESEFPDALESKDESVFGKTLTKALKEEFVSSFIGIHCEDFTDFAYLQEACDRAYREACINLFVHQIEKDFEGVIARVMKRASVRSMLRRAHQAGHEGTLRQALGLHLDLAIVRLLNQTDNQPPINRADYETVIYSVRDDFKTIMRSETQKALNKIVKGESEVEPLKKLLQQVKAQNTP